MVWNIFKVNNKDARTTSLASIRHCSDTPFMENSTKQNKIGSVINHLQFIITKVLSDKLIYVASDVRIAARDLVKRLIFNTYWSFNTNMWKCYLKTSLNRSPQIFQQCFTNAEDCIEHSGTSMMELLAKVVIG